MNHREAHAIIQRTGPSWAGPRARRLVQAVAWQESNYGRGWGRSCPQMATSHNWGAIQGAPGALCQDTHADGTSYFASYRIYPSDESGAAALWYQLLRRPTVVRVLRDDALDANGMAAAMRAPPLYMERSVEAYARGLRSALDQIARGL